MPSDNAAAEWISRNSVVFTVFKNCPKLSPSFFFRKKGKEFIITYPGTKYSSSPAECGLWRRRSYRIYIARIANAVPVALYSKVTMLMLIFRNVISVSSVKSQVTSL